MLPVLVLILMSCEGCVSCFGGLPAQNNKQDNGDKPDNTDDGDAGAGTGDGGHDTSPPPPCDIPEVEPNDARSEAQALPMENWACGFISELGDVETFVTDVPEAGWVTVWARGADFGSTADLQVFFENIEDNDLRASQNWMVGSTDALLTVPVDDPGDWLVQVLDERSSYSDTHEWQLIATMDKPPLDWDFHEDEAGGNNAIGTGQELRDGDLVYGVLDRNDQDYFWIDVPEGTTNLYLRVHAWRYGSPADTRLTLYKPKPGTTDEWVTERTKTSGENAYDQDPLIDRNAYEPGVWPVKIDLQGSGGSALYWYVLEVGVENTPSDTGGAG